MYCKQCGAEIDDNAAFCPKCGCSTGRTFSTQVSPKSRLVAFLLCFFFGLLGIHRFYVGRVGSGIVMILTCGGLGLWVLIDFIVILCGNFKDSKGLRISSWIDWHRDETGEKVPSGRENWAACREKTWHKFLAESSLTLRVAEPETGQTEALRKLRNRG